MNKFTRSVKNRNTRILVTKYNWPIEIYLREQAVLLHINCLDDILNISKHVDHTIKVTGFVYTDEFASLETIDIDPNWKDIPIILRINRLGQFRNIHYKLNLLKRMNVVIMFMGSLHQSCVDAQILSSLGIHTGIILKENTILNESILDLATYNFYNMMPHADIEPFSTLEKYYDGNCYVSPEMAYFVNPDRYVYVNKDFNLAFNMDDLKNNNFFGQGLNLIQDLDDNEAYLKKKNEWQEMFFEPHPCTFCPAFRICKGYFFKQQELDKCKQIMTEILEGIEFQKKKKQINQKQQCPL